MKTEAIDEHTTIVENQGVKIACADAIETWRAETLWTKEPGTVRWLQTAQPGDVVYDIGANIGLYTILAARQVGPTGHVYAFEPHAANLVSLARNIAINELQDRVTVVACAVGEAHGLLPFNYRMLRSGSSGSQLGHTIGEDGASFAPVAVQRTYQARIDGLLRMAAIPPASVVKIDVDGNEVKVLTGMGAWLSQPDRPRTLQVETRLATKHAIEELLFACGYSRVERHDTASGAKRIAAGADPESLAYNLVFQRAA